jgi:hypothetical protein
MGRPSPAMAVALGALVVAMGGTAMGQFGDAGNGVSRLLTGSDVQDESLTGADIDNGSLKGADIATGAIQSSDVKDGSLRITDLRSGAVDALTSQLVVRTFKGNKDAVAGDCAGVGQLVSGGVQASSPIEINRPYASEDGDPPTVWLGKASDPNDDIQVTVVCMT